MEFNGIFSPGTTICIENDIVPGTIGEDVDWVAYYQDILNQCLSKMTVCAK
eukprot:COSAG02_NODE_1330_length_13218_cov_8.247504_10_plen_51_part_00